MGRTVKSKEINSAESGFSETRLAEAEQATQELVRMNAETADNAHALAVEFGYEGALTVGAVEDEIRHYQRRTAEACFELGKRLLILKELTPHGEFRQRLELLGIEHQSANRFMAISSKFSNVSTSTLLKASQTQSKLLELLVLDDSEIEALEAGETVRNLNLDKIETMSVRELKAALREAKADAEAKDEVLSDKNKKLDELDKQLRRREIELVPWDERVGDLNGECSMIALGVEELLEKYWVILQGLTNAQFDNDVQDRARAMLAKNFFDRMQRIVERVAFIQAKMFEEFDGYINEPKYLMPQDNQD